MSHAIGAQRSSIKRVVFRAAGTLVLASASVFAQPQPVDKKVSFEVATIKLAPPEATPKNQMLRPSPNRISIPSMTLSWLIYTAYGEGMNTSVGLKGGPEWRNQTAYAIEAQASQQSTQRQFQAMLRTLLEDRFGLKVHMETETGSFYALVLDRSDGKLGPKVHPWDGTCLNGQMPTEDNDPVYPRCLSGYRSPGLFLDGATMFSAAELLSLPASRTLLGRVVQDQTGLTGRYRMELDYPFNPARPADPAVPDSRPSLFTVIREQWAMKLEPAQGPFKVIVVDSAQRPTEN